MTALTEFLFPSPARRSAPEVVRWWEGRGLPFNAFVGAAGLVSLCAVHVVAALPPFAHPLRMPWQPVVAFAFLANVCYLLGPTAELAINRIWGDRILPVGPMLFRMGLTFSIGLALLPTLLITLEWLFRMLRLIL